jgi:hypothetical protein
MKFYYRYATTYHNNTCIGCKVGKMLTDINPIAETIHITWDNLNEMYQKLGIDCKFNIWNFKKGRRVSFFIDSFFPKKDEKDVKEWKHPDLNIRIEFTYKEYSPSIAEVLKWYDIEKAIIYLNERGLKIN